ncbi:MAG: hypothetical protein JWR09_3382 [Mucilaginibacter sp.]|nr:hypothetical protein [Mucilaginibacter sp.]
MGFSLTTKYRNSNLYFPKVFMRDKDTYLNNSEIHRFYLFTNKVWSESRESPKEKVSNYQTYEVFETS